MKEFIGFLDESGNHDLETEKSGASKYFIIAAIIVDADSLDEFTTKLEKHRSLHFQAGEIKSSKVRDRDDHRRRIKLLEEFMEIDFRFFGLAVHKDKVQQERGLQHKRSFIKFINGLLYRRLLRSYPALTIYADEHGDSEFKRSFLTYMEKRHKPDLFWKSEIKLVNSKAHIGVQLADFIAGTLSKVYEGKSNDGLRETYLRLLAMKCIDLVEWPTTFQTYFPPDATSSEFDADIHRYSLAQAEAFLGDHAKIGDEETILQCAALSYLVFHSRMNPNKGYVSTHELISQLQARGLGKVSEQEVRSTIIAKLRDSGVIIASCSKGYKIPSGYSDLKDFVERVNGLVVPLLERLNKARNSLLSISEEVDILKGPDYPHLVSFLDELNK